MKSKILQSLAAFAAAFVGTVAAVAASNVGQARSYPMVPTEVVKISVGDKLSSGVQFTYAEVAEYLNAKLVDDMSNYGDARMQQLHSLVNGKIVNVYLVEDILFDETKHIEELPREWVIDGRYHDIVISKDYAGGSQDAETPASEYFKLTQVNPGDSQYYAGGFVVNHNDGCIKRLGFKVETRIQLPVFLNEDGAESVVFGTICGYNDGEVSEVNVDISADNTLSIEMANSGATESRMGGLVGVNAGVLSNSKSVINFDIQEYIIAGGNANQVLGTAVGALGLVGEVKNVVAGMSFSEAAASALQSVGFCGIYDEGVDSRLKGMNISSHKQTNEDLVITEIFQTDSPLAFGASGFKNYYFNDEPEVSPKGFFVARDNNLMLCGFAYRYIKEKSQYVRLSTDSIISSVLGREDLQFFLASGQLFPNQNTIEFLNMAFEAAQASPSDNFVADFDKTVKGWDKSGLSTYLFIMEHTSFDYYSLGRNSVFSVLPSGWTFDAKPVGTLSCRFVTDATLFDVIEEGAVLKNLYLTSDNPTLVFNDDNQAAVVANVNKGDIFNCWIMGSAIVNLKSSQTPYVIGAVAAQNEGTISSCFVNMYTRISTSGSVHIYAGGIAGQNDGGIITDALVHYNSEYPSIGIFSISTSDNANVTNGTVGYIVGNNINGGQVNSSFRTAYNQTIAGESQKPYVTDMYISSTINGNLRPATGNQRDGEVINFYQAQEGIDIDYTQPYFNLGGSVFGFANPSRWTMFSLYDHSVTDWGGVGITPVPNFTEMPANKVSVVDRHIVLTVDNEADFSDVAELILKASKNKADLLNQSVIEINSDLDLALGKDESYFDEWTANTNPAQVTTLPSFGTADNPFLGSINGNGHVIKNVIGKFSDGSLFGNLGSQTDNSAPSVINGLTLEGRIFVDINKYYTRGDGQEVIYIPVFAQNMNGEATAMNFAGEVWYDDSVFDGLTDDERPEVVICLVDQTRGESEVKNSFIYLFPDEVQSTNKACIVIKQNVGVGRGKGNKTASSKLTATDKAVGIFDPNTRTNDNEEFTAQEFASGEVAYWLNYVGKGFTGEFTSMYSQSTTRPVLATNTNGAVQRVDYNVLGLEGEMADYIDGPQFAKVGSDVAIEFYAQNPTEVSLDGQKLALNTDNKVNFKMKASNDGIAHLNITYPQTATSVDDVREASTMKVTTTSGSMTIMGAEGQTVRVYNVSGLMVSMFDAQTNAETIDLPQGFYIVAVGNEALKIALK